MGRPSKGLEHVDSLRGDELTKWRRKVILSTLCDLMLVEEACDELEIGPTQFATLRRQALQGALEALVPRAGGRPKQMEEASAAMVAALRAKNAQLEHEMQQMRARVELAVLPFLSKDSKPKRPKPRQAPDG